MLMRHGYFCESVWLAERRILQNYLGLLPLRRVVALLRRHFDSTIILVKAVISGVDILVRSVGKVCRCKICEQ